EAVIPYSDERAALSVADLYRRLGRPAELEERIRNVIPGRRISRDERFRLAYFYSQLFGEPDRAEELLLELLAENPTDMDVYSELFRVYKDSGQYDKAVEILEIWLRDVNPDDSHAQSELEALRRLAAEEGSGGE
ncbi:MAG TPA: tetratricopeptide repeat protein, partial [bacterium]|nr:tetratricopeptide repeat protein [bacterium]